MDEELDIIDLFYNFWKRKYVLLIAILFGIILGFICTRFFITPKYSSSTTLILSKPKDSASTTVDSDTITQSDISLNQKLISTYGEILKSKRVVNTVINNLKLNMTYDELMNGVKVSSVKDTDVIKITITTSDAKISKEVANELFKVFASEVDRIYGIKNVSIIDEAELETMPVNISYSKNMIIFGLVSFAVVAGAIFLMYYFDTSIKSEEDITKAVDLPVLATIPIIDSKKDIKKKDGSKHKKNMKEQKDTINYITGKNNKGKGGKKDA